MGVCPWGVMQEEESEEVGTWREESEGSRDAKEKKKRRTEAFSGFFSAVAPPAGHLRSKAISMCWKLVDCEWACRGQHQADLHKQPESLVCQYHRSTTQSAGAFCDNMHRLPLSQVRKLTCNLKYKAPPPQLT